MIHDDIQKNVLVGKANSLLQPAQYETTTATKTMATATATATATTL
jgi:hypothetical protein